LVLISVGRRLLEQNDTLFNITISQCARFTLGHASEFRRNWKMWSGSSRHVGCASDICTAGRQRNRAFPPESFEGRSCSGRPSNKSGYSATRFADSQPMQFRRVTNFAAPPVFIRSPMAKFHPGKLVHLTDPRLTRYHN